MEKRWPGLIVRDVDSALIAVHRYMVAYAPEDREAFITRFRDEMMRLTLADLQARRPLDWGMTARIYKLGDLWTGE